MISTCTIPQEIPQKTLTYDILNGLNVLSLFDGIAGGKVALERAGIKINKYYASEIDKYAIQVAMENHPDIIQLGDVKNIKSDDLPEIDLLIGGSPCQGFSVAGKRLNFNDQRSQLFFEYVRLLKEVKPKYFLLENVRMKKEWQDIISNLLGVEPICINSALLSAQQRKRLYWTNIKEIKQPQDKNILLQDILESGITYQDKSYCLTSSYNGAVFWNTLERKQRTMIAEPVRLGHLNKGGQGDRIYSVQGKSVCISANGGGRGAKTGLYKIDLPDGDYIIRKLTPVECERLQTFEDGYTEKGLHIHSPKLYNIVKKMNGGYIKCQNVELKDAKTQYLTEKQGCVISTIIDLKDMGQPNLQEQPLINLSNVQLVVAKEAKKQTQDYVLCIINDTKDMEQLGYLIEKLKNVNFAIEMQLREDSVISTIKIGLDTVTHSIPIKSKTEIINMDIKKVKESIELNTEKLLKKYLVGNLDNQKLCTTLTWINLITMKIICILAKTIPNTFVCINNLTVLQENLLKWDISDLKMESITSISNTQRYKCLGNSFTVDVIAYILKNIK
jgi:DNA (cytosine-5)-methyltransferase 3A